MVAIRDFGRLLSLSISVVSLTIAAVAVGNTALGAEDLKLRPGVSFTQDLDAGFPIIANKIEDLSVGSGVPTFMFFGASGDLNTNRQAKRLVDVYKKMDNKNVKFIIVDVDHATTDEAKKLIKTYYKGYIPCEVILDKTGKTTWSQLGEIESGVLKNQLDKVL